MNTYQVHMNFEWFELHVNFIIIARQVHKKFPCTTHDNGFWHPCYVLHRKADEYRKGPWCSSIYPTFVNSPWKHISQGNCICHFITDELGGSRNLLNFTDCLKNHVPCMHDMIEYSPYIYITKYFICVYYYIASYWCSWYGIWEQWLFISTSQS